MKTLADLMLVIFAGAVIARQSIKHDVPWWLMLIAGWALGVASVVWVMKIPNEAVLRLLR